MEKYNEEKEVLYDRLDSINKKLTETNNLSEETSKIVMLILENENTNLESIVNTMKSFQRTIGGISSWTVILLIWNTILTAYIVYTKFCN